MLLLVLLGVLVAVVVLLGGGARSTGGASRTGGLADAVLPGLAAKLSALSRQIQHSVNGTTVSEPHCDAAMHHSMQCMRQLERTTTSSMLIWNASSLAALTMEQCRTCSSCARNFSSPVC